MIDIYVQAWRDGEQNSSSESEDIIPIYSRSQVGEDG